MSEIETTKCTLCAAVESPGFYTGCMCKDLGPQNGWVCDGNGNLTRKGEATFKYRDHRGMLDESMKTVREFNSKQELYDYFQSILDRYHMNNLDVNNTQIKHYAFDSRIGWDNYIVSLDGWGVFGFTDGEVTP